MRWRKVLAWEIQQDFRPGDVVESTNPVPSQMGLLPVGTKGVVSHGSATFGTEEYYLSIALTIEGNRGPVPLIMSPHDLKLVSREPLPLRVGVYVSLLTALPVERGDYEGQLAHPGSEGQIIHKDADGRWRVAVMLSNGYHADARVQESDVVRIWPVE